MKKSSLFLSGLLLANLLLGSPIARANDGDLTISDSDITFSSDTFLEGRSVRIRASVHNNSEGDLLGFVRFTANGVQIGSDQPISALAGKTDDVFVDWDPSSYGNQSISVSVIPWENSGDNPSNNTVVKTAYVDQDSDHDTFPNTVDRDDDGDGTADVDDAFPLNNHESKDSDGDGIGNNEDTDDDNDSILDAEDAFPEDATYSKDTDKDGTPDETDEDIDGDGILNTDENSAGTDPTITDTDGDKVSDKEDSFPTDSTEWADTNGNGVGDNLDPDIDGDGIPNADDLDPSNPAPTAQADQDVFIADVGDSVTFSADNSNDDNAITKYIWDFDGEKVEGSTVTRKFDAKGLQTATLTVFDQNGQSSTTEVSVHVFDYEFLMKAGVFSLLLVLLAFYLVLRYNRRALNQK